MGLVDDSLRRLISELSKLRLPSLSLGSSTFVSEDEAQASRTSAPSLSVERLFEQVMDMFGPSKLWIDVASSLKEMCVVVVVDYYKLALIDQRQ